MDESCLAFIGRELWVRPYYGWGWHRDGKPLDNDAFEHIEAAGSFALRVERFFTFRGVLRGIVGSVTSAEHPFAGLYVVAAEMHDGHHDFEEHLCRRYDLWIGPSVPTDDEWPRIEGAGVIDGYGTVGATREYIESFWVAPVG